MNARAICRQRWPLLAQADDSAKIIAGGQSLGPMLNLRLVEPH